MKKNGFTLIELIVCLFVITILMLLILPNLNEQRNFIKDTGCASYVKLVNSQSEAYQIKTGNVPTVSILTDKNYITDSFCPADHPIVLDANGKVVPHPTPTQ